MLDPGKQLECDVAAAFAAAGMFVVRNAELEEEESGRQITDVDVWAWEMSPAEVRCWIAQCTTDDSEPYKKAIHTMGMVHYVEHVHGDAVKVTGLHVTPRQIDLPNCPPDLKLLTGVTANNRADRLQSVLHFDIQAWQDWRIAFKVDVLMRQVLQKASGQGPCCHKANEIARRIASQTLWLESPLVREGHLLECHQEEPQLYRKVAEEIRSSSSPDWFAPAAQAAAYVQFKNRMLVALCVAQEACRQLAEGPPKSPLAIRVASRQAFPDAVSLLVDMGPVGAAKFPVFLQAFLLRWGGFIWEKRRKDDIASIGQEQGVTAAEVGQWLEVYSKLFSADGDPFQLWFNNNRQLKGYPPICKGLGVRTRQALYQLPWIGEWSEWLRHLEEFLKNGGDD